MSFPTSLLPDWTLDSSTSSSRRSRVELLIFPAFAYISYYNQCLANHMLLVVLPFYSTFIKRAVLMFSPSLFLIWFFTSRIQLFTVFSMLSFCYGSFSFLQSLFCSTQLFLHSAYCFLFFFFFFPSIFAFLMAFFLGIFVGTASWTVSNSVQLTARLIFRIFSDYFK